MNIVWFTWKDKKHPEAGGAELVNEELAIQLSKHGHKVKFIVSGFSGSKEQEVVDGFRVIRLGNRFTVYYQAWRYFKHQKLDDWADLIIDEVNTIPFFAKFYTHKPTILFIHMLCREVWWYQIFFPASLVGYLAEPLYLRLLSKQKVITVSKSTQDDLVKYGFKKQDISIIPEIIDIKPAVNINKIEKSKNPTLLILGSIRPMKRTLDSISAFELAKTKIPNLKLVIVGDASGKYGRRTLRAIKNSSYFKDINYVGRVTKKKKIELMQKSHLIIVTSVKEGWGLIVSEAASQGTPAVVYDVDGLRDSVRNNWSGCVVSNINPSHLSGKIVELIDDSRKYNRFRTNGYEWSKELNADKSFVAFREIVGI